VCRLIIAWEAGHLYDWVSLVWVAMPPVGLEVAGERLNSSSFFFWFDPEGRELDVSV
jgi:hypothetical protein